jgi:hypothetical protein
VNKYSITEYLQEQNLIQNPTDLSHTGHVQEQENQDDELDPITLMENDDRRNKYLNHIPWKYRAIYDSLLVEIYRFHYLGLLIPTDTKQIQTDERFYNRSPHHLRQIPQAIYARLKCITPRAFLSIFPNVIGEISIHIEPAAIHNRKNKMEHEYSPTKIRPPRMDKYLTGSHLSKEVPN